MPSHIAASTNPDLYTGRNIFGLLLIKVRDEIVSRQKTDKLPSTSAFCCTQALVTAEGDFDVGVPKYPPLHPSGKFEKSIAGEFSELEEERNIQNALSPSPLSSPSSTSAEASTSSSSAQ